MCINHPLAFRSSQKCLDGHLASTYILNFPLGFHPNLPPPLVLSVFPGCPALFPSLGLFIWVAVTTPPTPHTQTRGMHFRQGANGKINYQQPKSPGAALLLVGKKGGQEKVKGREDKNERKKWTDRTLAGRTTEGAEMTGGKWVSGSRAVRDAKR